MSEFERADVPRRHFLRLLASVAALGIVSAVPGLSRALAEPEPAQSPMKRYEITVLLRLADGATPEQERRFSVFMKGLEKSASP